MGRGSIAESGRAGQKDRFDPEQADRARVEVLLGIDQALKTLRNLHARTEGSGNRSVEESFREAIAHVIALQRTLEKKDALEPEPLSERKDS